MLALKTYLHLILPPAGLGRRAVCASLAIMFLVTECSCLVAVESGEYSCRSLSPRSEIPASRLSNRATIPHNRRRQPQSISERWPRLTNFVPRIEHLKRALTENQAQPRSLASADFDEDGVPDLVSGYAYAGRGIVTIHRGNVDSIYPTLRSQATQS
jgi:hypothetical protein